MKQYSFEHYMRTHRSVDYLSLQEALNKAIEMDYSYQDRQKQYYWRYSDEINLLANSAGYLWNDLECLAYELGNILPYRNTRFYAEDEIQASGIAWFNVAIASLPDSNLIAALINEEDTAKLPDGRDALFTADYKLRKARMNLMNQLRKEQLALLLVSVCGMVARVSEVQAACVMLLGLIDELDYQHNVVVKKDGTVMHNPASYL